MKENIEIQATSFERIRPYRMNEASENGEVSAAIESMGKHGSINSYFYVKLSAQLLAQLPAFKEPLNKSPSFSAERENRRLPLGSSDSVGK